MSQYYGKGGKNYLNLGIVRHLNGWILPIGGASAVEGLRSTGLPHLVSLSPHNYDERSFNLVSLRSADIILAFFFL